MAVGSRCWDYCPEGCGHLGDKCSHPIPPLAVVPRASHWLPPSSGLALVLRALATLKETQNLNFGAKFPYLKYWYLI